MTSTARPPSARSGVPSSSRMSSEPGAEAAPAASAPWVVRRARALIHRRLERLRDARIVLSDPWTERCVFGSGDSGGRACALRIHDPVVYQRVLFGGSIAAGETCRDGLWSTDDLTALTRAFVRNRDVLLSIDGAWTAPARWAARAAHALRRNTRRGSRRNIEAHYDLDGRFFALFLDPSMTYSSAVYDAPRMSLEAAQEAKYERLCRRLRLRPGMEVLEIGCGWGGFALYAARRFGARVHAVTISPSQFRTAVERVRAAGLCDQVRVELRDYRDLVREGRARYDAIASIEMIEAVGPQYYGTFFDVCAHVLRDRGAVALQAIVMPDALRRHALRGVDFIQAHVFPGSSIPSVTALTAAAGRTGRLRLDALEDLTPHYVTTLHAWSQRLADRADEARRLGHDDAFQRLWQFYLAYCAGGFAERALNLVHLVFGMPDHAPASMSRASTSASL